MASTYQEPEWEGTPRPTWNQRLFKKDKKLCSTDGEIKEGPPQNGTIAALSLRDRFDAFLPAHKRYFGRSRRTFLLILLGAIVLLVLVLGLGLGLGLKKSGDSEALPLPSNGATFTGDLTYYGTGLGSCGIDSKDTEMICAVSHLLYDAASTSGNPNENPLCGKKLRIERVDERDGRKHSIDVTIVDRCVGCKANDIDLSPSAFDKLADEALGRVKGSWAWLN